MKINCTFEDFTFNTGKKFYQCIIKDQKIPQNDQFELSGYHLPEKYDSDVTFVEFRDCDCPKVPQGLTKIFPNLKVLGFDNSKLKELTKNDMAEYIKLEKFICNKNEVEFLPGNLFEGFEDLSYLKFTYNKLAVIEPHLLDDLLNLEYVNFTGNINISQFYASNMTYNPNALLGEIQRTFFENFIFLEPIERIQSYIESSKDPKKTLMTFRRYSNDKYNICDANKIKILEVSSRIHDKIRGEEFNKLKSSEENLLQKVKELEESNGKMAQQIQELDELELKLNQQIEDLKMELENKKAEKEKLQKNLQKQIDSLAQQIQSIWAKSD